MASSICCRYAALMEPAADQSDAAARWLSPGECRAWHRMRSPQRRATWLAGRMLAKRLLLESLALSGELDSWPSGAEIHIESVDAGHGQRPSVFVWGRPLHWALSISHTARGVLAAVTTEPGVTLGVDLVCRRDHPTNRLAWCFTPAELRWLAAGPAHRREPEQLWAMKEALYKACQQGEGFAPRRIEVVPGAAPRYPILDSSRAVRSLQAWRVCGHFAALAVAERAAAAGDKISTRRHRASELNVLC
ncbi:MAG: 4'-phosphopantetheinyl transferase superfamily protein [Pirellulales bacterium]